MYFYVYMSTPVYISMYFDIFSVYMFIPIIFIDIYFNVHKVWNLPSNTLLTSFSLLNIVQFTEHRFRSVNILLKL